MPTTGQQIVNSLVILAIAVGTVNSVRHGIKQPETGFWVLYVVKVVGKASWEARYIQILERAYTL